MRKFKAGDKVRVNDVDGLTAEGVFRNYYAGVDCSVKITRIINVTQQCLDAFGYAISNLKDLTWGCPANKLTPLNISYKRIFIQKVTDNAKHW